MPKSASKKSTSKQLPIWRHWVSISSIWAGRAIAIALLVASPWNAGMVSWQSQELLLPWCTAVLMLGVVSTLAAGAQQLRMVLAPATLALGLLVSAAAVQTVILPESVWRFIGAGAKWEKAILEEAKELSELLPVRPEPLVPVEQPDRDRDVSVESRSFSSETARNAIFPRTLSLHPIQTQASLSVFAAAVAFFIGCGLLFGDREGSLILLASLSLSILNFALYGLVQEFRGVHAGVRGFSSLISPNSSPQLLAVGFGALLGLLSWWTARRRRLNPETHAKLQYQSVNPIARLRRRLDEAIGNMDLVTGTLTLGLALLFVAVVATGSRGGMLGFFAALFLAGLAPVLAPRKKDDPNFMGSIALFVVVLAGCVAISFLGLNGTSMSELALSELASINEEAHTRSDIRFDLWKWSVTEPSYWLFGAGLGTYHFAILPCYGQISNTWYYHAENIFVEVFTEFGIVGLVVMVVLLAGLLVLLGRSRARQQANRALGPAMAFVFCSLTLQLFVDFSLVIPGIFLPVAALTGVFVASSSIPAPSKRRHRDARQEAAENQRNRNAKVASGKDSCKNESRKGRVISILPGWIALPLLLAAIWQGADSLRGYAIGEQIQAIAQQVGGKSDEGDSLALLKAVRYESHLWHPEVAVQLAWLKQRLVRSAVACNPSWPENLDKQTKLSLSAPETLAAVNRGGASGYLAELAPVLASEAKRLEMLQLTSVIFRQAAETCPLDWRAQWGMLRSNIGQMGDGQAAVAYAVLQLTGKHRADTLESAGITAIWAGEGPIGHRLIQMSHADDPKRALRLIQYVGLMSPDDLMASVPEPLTVAQLLQRLVSNKRVSPEIKNLAEQLVPRVPREEIATLANNEQEWLAVAYIAEAQGDTRMAIEAMERVKSTRPFNLEYRYQLAKLFQKNGELEQAVRAMKSMGGGLMESKKYERFLAELEDLQRDGGLRSGSR